MIRKATPPWVSVSRSQGAQGALESRVVTVRRRRPLASDGWALDSDPDDAHDDVHALALTAIVLEAPHAIRLLVPESLGSRVHAPAADVRLAVGAHGSIVVAGANMGVIGLAVATALGLVQGRGGDQVLDNGRVDDELVRGPLAAVAAGRRRLGDESLED